jgi:hypothetical protein
VEVSYALDGSDCLPETKGNVERFIVNPDGEADGVILSGAIEAALIHVPPHLSAEIEAGIQIGDSVRVRGVRRNEDDRGRRTNRG